MNHDLYRYQFTAPVRVEDIEATVVLAIFATESLHGEAQVRLDVRHALDPQTGACVVDASTAAGKDFNRLFVGFILREFGEEAFRVERITDEAPARDPQPAGC